MVLQVVDELCSAGRVLTDLFAQIVQSHVGGEQLGGREVALAVLDVLPVVLPQTLPRGGVQDEGRRLEDDGDADVQMPVGHVVVEHAGSFLAADGAPEQTGGVDSHPEDQRGRDEACSSSGVGGEEDRQQVKSQEEHRFELSCMRTDSLRRSVPSR